MRPAQCLNSLRGDSKRLPTEQLVTFSGGGGWHAEGLAHQGDTGADQLCNLPQMLAVLFKRRETPECESSDTHRTEDHRNASPRGS